MTIQEFADKYYLKATINNCGELVILGKRHHLGKRFLPPCIITGAEQFPTIDLFYATPNRWTYAKKRGIAIGMKLSLDGHAEGSLIFDLGDETQARLAIKLAGIRCRRVLSQRHRERLIQAGEGTRIKAPGSKVPALTLESTQNSGSQNV